MMAAMAIRLVLVDDHPIVLDGLECLFGLEPDLEVVASCRDAAGAVPAVQQHRPDVLLLDCRLPGRDGLDVLRELRQQGLSTRVVMFTAAMSGGETAEAVRLGVRGIVLKEMTPRRLVHCIRRVHAGDLVLAPTPGADARSTEPANGGKGRAGALLSARELEVVRLVASGLRNREIALRLGVAEGTVKIHLQHIYEKLEIDGRLALILAARQHGWA
jgi:DNA-binding NarL/FixJ family response regulator